LFIARRRDRPSESQVSPRAEWYDRNPSLQTSGWGMDASPHTLTDRFAYTVPTGKKAIVSLLSATIQRRTAATTLGLAQARITMRGTTAISALLQNNTVGEGRLIGVGTSALLSAGDQVVGSTSDDSTGGTVAYLLVAHLTAFDA